ncbi:hypothetical protein SAMN00120144_0564 [Hymenobacter roseosalivarius DSM 11622]|uniref:Uncharacterized protein n=1 Tax=Hymenobacter roseosalivarius DSM 11622 TaxID=645990 RepID=A0A1W1VCC9_9BACT|nr:hypothetical protein [Hymenobacter roseosalivarius]SMB90711.1 hypothetical protein SAMN00120144_0564 [Hymenobacter roseosalivarius DSM 11622]
MKYTVLLACRGQLQAMTGLPESASAHLLHTVFATVVDHADVILRQDCGRVQYLKYENPNRVPPMYQEVRG